MESCGCEKEKDLVAILVVQNDRANARIERLAARIKRNKNIYVRGANKKNFHSEMEIFKDIYNSAWARNWGFVPMSEEEMTHMGKELLQVMDADLVFFVYYDDEPVGAALILPDINPS